MFGCGLGAACVVDVGDEKTSVCCVEDGLVIPRSRYCKHVFFHKEGEIALDSLVLNGYWREGYVLGGFEPRALCDLSWWGYGFRTLVIFRVSSQGSLSKYVMFLKFEGWLVCISDIHL